jgi:hypothetical protein
LEIRNLIWGFVFQFRKRKANRELAMEKLKEGNANAATEFFQV